MGKPKNKPLVFIDIETTGIRPGFHEIIEIGAIKVIGEDQQSFVARMMPIFPERAEAEALAVNDFSPEKWEKLGHIPHQVAWKRFNDFIRDCFPVAHNATFDRSFLERKNRLDCDYHWTDTSSLAMPLYLSGKIRYTSLKTLCKYFDIEPEPEIHEAVNGARKCAEVYYALMDLYGSVIH